MSNDKFEDLREKALATTDFDHNRVGFFSLSGDGIVPLSQLVVLTITTGRFPRKYSHGNHRPVTLSVLPAVYFGREVVIGGRSMFFRPAGRNDGTMVVRFSDKQGPGMRPVGLMRDLLETDRDKRRNYAFIPGRRSWINTDARVADDKLMTWASELLDQEAVEMPRVRLPRFLAPVTREESFLTLRGPHKRETLHDRLVKCCNTGEWPIPGTGIMSYADGVVSAQNGTMSLKYETEDGPSEEVLPSTSEVSTVLSNQLNELFGIPRRIFLTPVVTSGESPVAEMGTLFRPIPVGDYKIFQLCDNSRYEELALLAALTSLTRSEGIPMLDLRYAHSSDEPFVDLSTVPAVQTLPVSEEAMQERNEAVRADLYNHSLRHWLITKGVADKAAKAKAAKAKVKPTAFGRQLKAAVKQAEEAVKEGEPREGPAKDEAVKIEVEVGLQQEIAAS